MRSSRASAPVVLIIPDVEVITATKTLNPQTLKRCTRTRNGTRNLADELGMAKMQTAIGINTMKTIREALITPVQSELRMFQSQFAGGVSRWR